MIAGKRELLKGAGWIGFASVPVGIVLGGLHELGLFTALGLSDPWKFLVAFPISLADLIKVTWVLGIFYAFICALAIVVVGTLVATGRMYFEFCRAVLGLDLVDEGKPAPLSFQFLDTLRERVCRIGTSVLAAMRAEGTKGMLLTVAIWLGMSLAIWWVAFPLIDLLGLWMGADSFFLRAFVSLSAATACAYLFCWGIVWTRYGRSMRVVLFPSLHSQMQYLAFGLLFGMFVAYDRGYREGMYLVSPPNTKEVVSYAKAKFNGNCTTPSPPTMVRAYTSGVLVVVDKEMYWHPSDDRSPCWSLHLDQRNVAWEVITPTVFGVPLRTFSFQTLSVK